MVLVLRVFHFSLCAHPLFMTPPPAPSLTVPCYLFGHVARLSSLETHARLSVCFLKTLFKIEFQKNRKDRVGWMEGKRLEDRMLQFTSPSGRWFVCILAGSSVVVQEVVVPWICPICPSCALHLTNMQAEENRINKWIDAHSRAVCRCDLLALFPLLWNTFF